MNTQEIYDELMDIYQDYKPDDVEDDEDLMNEMEQLDSLSPKDEKETKMAISQLSYFVGNWFPDGADEEEQTRIKEVLEESTKIQE